MNPKDTAASIYRFFGTAAIATVSLGFSATSHAYGASPDERSVTVEFASASASTPVGAATLYRQIQGAAEDVCSVLDHGDLSSKRIFHDCVRDTIANAVQTVNRQALTEVFEMHNPPMHSKQLLAAQQR